MLINVSGSSGVGKTTISTIISLILSNLNRGVLHLCGDDLHKWERGDENWKTITHLNPEANNLDLGCKQITSLLSGKTVKRDHYDHNTGKFIKTAIKLKTEVIIGIDFDETVVRKLFLESKNYDYKILTLVMDLSNPSPSQGWLELERMSFKNRFKTDSLIALALIHHLAITKNIPINQILSWIVDFAPTGLVEFIPSSDQMVRQMTYFRESLHEEYSLNYFENCLSKIANITKKTEVSNSGRTVYEYLRKQ